MSHIACHKVFPMNTGESVCIVFKTDQYEGTLYISLCPYFVGTRLWNEMSKSDIELPDIYSFKKCLKRKNMVYIDLL